MPDIYLNPKVDPLYALMEECNISTEVLDEANNSFIDRVIETIKSIATKIKEVICKVITKLSQALNTDMAYIKANEKKLDSGFQMIRSSGSKLEIADMYTPESYDKFCEAVRNMPKDVSAEYSVCLDSAYDLCKKFSKQETPSMKDIVLTAKFTQLDPETEYCDRMIKLPVSIEYGKIGEALDASFKKESKSIAWTHPSDLKKTAQNAVDMSKEISNKLHKMKNICDYCIDSTRNIKMKSAVMVHGEVLKTINTCVSKCMKLLKGHNEIIANVVSFNNRMITDVRKFYLGTAKLYVKFANTDMIEASKTYTIGKAQEVQESYNHGIFADLQLV